MPNTVVRPVGITGAIGRGIVLVVELAVLGALLGFVASRSSEDSSTAMTPILLNPLDGNPYDTTRQGTALTNLQTEAQVLKSVSVADLVAQSLGDGSSTDMLLAGVSVANPSNTQILHVRYANADAEVARARSQAFAEQYLVFRQQRAQALIDGETASLTEQIDARQTERDALGAQLVTLDSSSGQYQVVLQQIAAISNEVSALSTRRSELAAQPTNPGQVVSAASISGAGFLDTRIVMPIAGLVLGLLTGASIALLRSRADPTVHDAHDVRDLGVPVIGSITGIDPDGVDTDRENVLDDEYRKLRVAILSLEQRRPFTLLVSSARSDATVPLTAIDLATSFARAGLDTILIDATEHRTGPGAVLAPDDTDGLAEVLVGNTMLNNTLVPVAPMFWVLPPGHDIAAMSDLFLGEEMAEVLVRARRHSDVVIVATSSIQHADGQSLASMSDAVIIEVEPDLTRRYEIERARTTLDVLPCSLLGSVVIGPEVELRRPGFRPETAVNRRQLRRGSTRGELPPGPAPARPMPVPGDTDQARDGSPESAIATYDRERRTWLVAGGWPLDDDTPDDEAEIKQAAAEQAPARKSSAPPRAAKKAPAKRTAARKAPAKKSAAKKTTTRSATTEPSTTEAPAQPPLDLTEPPAAPTAPAGDSDDERFAEDDNAEQVDPEHVETTEANLTTTPTEPMEFPDAPPATTLEEVNGDVLRPEAERR